MPIIKEGVEGQALKRMDKVVKSCAGDNISDKPFRNNSIALFQTGSYLGFAANVGDGYINFDIGFIIER